MIDFSLKENAEHGSASTPIEIYSAWKQDEIVSVPLHWHEEIEIIYVESGTLTVERDMVKETFYAGDFCFFNKGQLHKLIATDKGCQHYAVLFNLKMLGFDFFDEAQSEIIFPLISEKMFFPYKINNCSILKNEFFNIVKTVSDKDFMWYINAKASLLKIIAILAKENLFDLPKEISINQPYRIEIIKKIILYIQAHYSEKIKIDDLAAQVNFNTQYFCRFFKKATGKQPVEYINYYRIHQAAVLLLTTRRNVIDIASSVGFENYSYFIRKFREIMGCTPVQYKRQANESHSTN